MTQARAFTAVELLVATAISAVLMVAVLRVTTTLHRGAAAFEAGVTHREPWRQNLLEVLRIDLLHAVSLRAGENGVEMVGLYGLGVEDHRPRHTPVRVVYRVEEVAGRRWLFREETDLASLGNRNWRQEPLCRGVSGFRIQGFSMPHDETERETPDGEDAGDENQDARDDDVPAQVSVQVLFDDGSDPIAQTLVLR